MPTDTTNIHKSQRSLHTWWIGPIRNAVAAFCFSTATTDSIHLPTVQPSLLPKWANLHGHMGIYIGRARIGTTLIINISPLFPGRHDPSHVGNRRRQVARHCQDVSCFLQHKHDKTWVFLKAQQKKHKTRLLTWFAAATGGSATTGGKVGDMSWLPNKAATKSFKPKSFGICKNIKKYCLRLVSAILRQWVSNHTGISPFHPELCAQSSAAKATVHKPNHT